MSDLKRTIKEQEFLKAYIELKGNATKAYSRVFPHVKLGSARRLGSALLTKLDIPIAELLNLMGIDDHILNQKLEAGLNAKTKEGKPLYYVQAKYLDMILRIKAKYPIEEARLRLPGATGGATSVILRELIYSKGNKDPKDTKDKDNNRVKHKLEEPVTVDTPPF